MRRLLAALLVSTVAAGPALAALPEAAPAPALRTTEVREVFGDGGVISRVTMTLPVGSPLTAAELAAASGEVSSLQEGGPSAARYDLVIVGDGYTAAELPLFRQHAAAHWARTKATEPFTDYADFFNVWVVDVVSNESGVDNDPDPTVKKDTALDSGFYCQGIERGLCVNETKARQMAAKAPAADQILVLANSTKYGGIGGSVATASGGNGLSELITVHELGHSLGGLADEYDYYARAGLEDDAAQDVTVPAPYLYYPAAVLGEPGGVNTTAASTPTALLAGKLKWWRWLGEPSPDGGVVGTFEGSGYYRYGQFRPTQDSLMHTLGSPTDPNPFNLPSREKMVASFYTKVRPVDDVSPAAGTALAPGDRVTLSLVGPRSRPLAVRWSVDGVDLPELDGATSIVVTDALAAGATLTAAVRDETPFVRDPAYVERLTRTIAWPV